MSLKFRRILYIIFIMAFLVITPLVCLYAAGYKVTSNFRIAKTGMLVISTRPKGADIYLNGERQQLFLDKYFGQGNNYVRTPAKIKNLLPGDYDIRLELPGYWPWQKKLEVKPGETTYAEDIYLFKNDLPLSLADGAFDNFSLSPNKKYLLAQNDGGIKLVNLGNGEENDYELTGKTAPAAATPGRPFLWSSGSQKFIFNRSLFDVSDLGRPSDLDAILGPQADQFQWDDTDDNVLYYSNNGSIYAYNLSRGEHAALTTAHTFSAYLIKDNALYLLNQSGQSVTLELWNLNNAALTSRFQLPGSTYAFLHPERSYINLYDTKYRILYLIDPRADIRPLRESISNVNETYWINDNELLYANDSEIWILDLDGYRKNLLTRISNPIKNIFWHPSGRYVIYTTDRDINIIELDKRDKYNITRLIQLNNIGWSAISKKADSIYFYAKIGSKQGVYQLKIQ